MCGICGILDFSADHPPYEGRVRDMADAMVHRGPDAGGSFLSGPIAMGHRRLSIIDLSSSADQPMSDPSGRYTLVFNGELYNYRSVREDLGSYPFRTDSDTEVLLAAFLTWGPRCIDRFNGIFAFAVWDREQRKLWLVRDRFGVKPLYFHREGPRLLFASEIRSLLASGLLRPELDRGALYDFLSFQSFGHPLSPIRGVYQLQAGSFLEVSEQSFERTVYWRPGIHRPDFDFGDAAAVRARVRDLLQGSVSRRLVSDVPVGAFLSGGIDSSAIVALMAESSTQPPNTFNVSMSETDFDESGFASLVARRFGARHETIRLDEEGFLGLLYEALDAMDSPSADGPNTYVVSSAVRKAGIKVVLSGVGGDELFAGYPFFRTWKRMQRWRTLFNATQAIRGPLARLVALHTSARAGRLASLLSAPVMQVSTTYPEFRRILPGSGIRALTRLEDRESPCLDERMEGIDDRYPGLSATSLLSIAEYAGYAGQTLLKDSDQMGMSVSLEIREPFFDHALVDFVLHVPDGIKLGVGPKSLLVESMSGLLPKEVVYRRKQGFLLPWERWMRGALRELCEDRIRSHAGRPFIRGGELLARWRRFQSGDKSVHWQVLWQFVVLEHWMQKNRIE